MRITRAPRFAAVSCTHASRTSLATRT